MSAHIAASMEIWFAGMGMGGGAKLVLPVRVFMRAHEVAEPE